MLKVIDLVYYSHDDYKSPQPVLAIHAPANGFAGFMKDRIDLRFVKHLDYEGEEKIKGIQYAFFKRKNRFWQIPFKTHQYIKSQQPDIVIVEGLIFPLQLMMLKYKLGKKVKIIAQHHGEKPFKGIKGFFQKQADKYIDAYLFTSYDNARPWLNKKYIAESGKCKEVLEASTSFSRKDKASSRERLSIRGSTNFLWVGGLDENKDPITVLKGFEKFIADEPAAHLYMIYQRDELLPVVKKLLAENDMLQKKVTLVGKIPNEELAYWYSAADFYISGSHKEGSGYALLEAMACGCIPVVTDIPSFRTITGDGNYGFLYPAGNAKALTILLNELKHVNTTEFSAGVEKYFNEKLGFKNIADDLFRICSGLHQT